MVMAGFRFRFSLLWRSFRSTMARTRQCIRRCQSARRRRVRSAWHRAGQGATKQSTWDDFIAVADDLIRRKVTSPRRLGVIGGSQGGLLVGTAITQRPELFNAAIIKVPLFDMLRFTQLGAGASWSAEYGDPTISYLPYQKPVPGRASPEPFIFHLHQPRSRPSCARPQGRREARCTGPVLFLL
ncbi:prolyl oligopeptidase family serine peptidase [Bradyrhizobium sp. LMG 9283]|uniref:prolyl oligopeptidase family serine peptidase n=1 Tax=Bradyrhizobium sp. LMG 9283 TaxID=592064 RepID=UPI00389023DB